MRLKIYMITTLVFLCQANVCFSGKTINSYVFQGLTFGKPKTDEMIAPTSYEWENRASSWNIGTGENQHLIEVFEKNGAKSEFGGDSVDRIDYYYLDGLLYKVHIEFNYYSIDKFEKLLIMKFGNNFKSAKSKIYKSFFTTNLIKSAQMNNENIFVSLIKIYNNGNGNLSSTYIEYEDVNLKKIVDKINKEEEIINNKEKQNRKKKSLDNM